MSNFSAWKFIRYPITSAGTCESGSFVGVSTWGIVSDSINVYFAEYGFSCIGVLNKSTGNITEIPIPVTSDTEQVHSLALANGDLYFTLSDDAAAPNNGIDFGDSTFGYINTSSIGTTNLTGTLYSGLAQYVDPAPASDKYFSQSDFRGISVGPNTDLAITDLHKIVHLKLVS